EVATLGVERLPYSEDFHLPVWTPDGQLPRSVEELVPIGWNVYAMLGEHVLVVVEHRGADAERDRSQLAGTGDAGSYQRADQIVGVVATSRALDTGGGRFEELEDLIVEPALLDREHVVTPGASDELHDRLLEQVGG